MPRMPADPAWLCVCASSQVLSMVTGASMYAVALAFACNVLQSVDHAARRYQNVLLEVNELMRVRCFPKSLRERVRKVSVGLLSAPPHDPRTP